VIIARIHMRIAVLGLCYALDANNIIDQLLCRAYNGSGVRVTLKGTRYLVQACHPPANGASDSVRSSWKTSILTAGTGNMCESESRSGCAKRK
jgi:hypothetical protein